MLPWTSQSQMARICQASEAGVTLTLLLLLYTG